VGGGGGRKERKREGGKRRTKEKMEETRELCGERWLSQGGVRGAKPPENEKGGCWGGEAPPDLKNI
jgi:hypothetical protein